jgi:two-component system OmpR family response regulator
MSKILIVEDDPELCRTISDLLRYERHIVEIVHDGQIAEQQVHNYAYDLVILDLRLPNVDGIQVCKSLRKSDKATPILMLTGNRDINMKELGLDSGADDYLTKPFAARELSARVRALLRRAAVAKNSILSVGDLVMNTTARKVTRHGQEVKLTVLQFSVLELLMRHPGTFFTADALIERVWKTDSEAVTDTVRTTIKCLRRKIDSSGRESLIESAQGWGYRIRGVAETPER